MNKNVLTLLGCSGSLALMLATAGIAMADSATGNATVAEGSAVDITFSAPAKASSDGVQLQYASVDPASDTIGDLAIAKFRCDCNACRMAVVQLLQTGQLSL